MCWLGCFGPLGDISSTSRRGGVGVAAVIAARVDVDDAQCGLRSTEGPGPHAVGDGAAGGVGVEGWEWDCTVLSLGKAARDIAGQLDGFGRQLR
jgi:hypothetical protein